MGYEIALDRAWIELRELAARSEYALPFLKDIYQVNVATRTVQREPAGAAAQEAALLILHYLIGILRQGYHPCGEWISFRELKGGITFYPAFRDSTLEPLLERWKRDPEGLLGELADLGGRKADGGDTSFELTVLPGVQVRLVFWKGDADLPPEVGILFDRGLAGIYSTEDIAVLMLLITKRITKNEMAGRML